MNNKIDIIPLNNKEQRHGLWVWYSYDGGGKLMCQRFYHNDNEVGYEEWFFSKGLTEIKTYYL